MDSDESNTNIEIQQQEDKSEAKVETAREVRLQSHAPRRPLIHNIDREGGFDEQALRQRLQDKVEAVRTAHNLSKDETEDFEICRLPDAPQLNGSIESQTHAQADSGSEPSKLSLSSTGKGKSVTSAALSRNTIKSDGGALPSSTTVKSKQSSGPATSVVSVKKSEKLNCGSSDSILSESESEILDGAGSSVNEQRKSAQKCVGQTRGKQSVKVDSVPSRKENIQHSAPEEFISAAESGGVFTQNPEFIIPGPNPTRISNNELMKIFKGFNNMHLAHEISLNPAFRLEHYIPPAESMEGRVRVQLKRAYWDLFNEEIHKNPPEYHRALLIFKEIKEIILGLLMPYNVKTREMINRELDVELISQRIKHDAFTYDDFQKYAQFIIQTMAQLCSPVRDADIEDLKKLEEPAEIFAGILELSEKMQLDMANYYLQQYRPDIIRHNAQYERTRFADFLIVERSLRSDGLKSTRKWLSKQAGERKDVSVVLSKAFVDLLSSNFEDETPETVALDIGRFHQGAQTCLRLAIVAAISFIGSGHLHALVGKSSDDFNDLLTKHMLIIFGDDDVMNPGKLKDRIEAATEQALVVVNQVVREKVNRDMSSAEANTLRQSVREVANQDNKVRQLIYRRILDFAESAFVSQYQFHATVPTKLYNIRTEVLALVKDLAHVVWHNREVYGLLYESLINGEVGTFTNFDDNSSDPEFVKVLQILYKNCLSSPQTVTS